MKTFLSALFAVALIGIQSANAEIVINEFRPNPPGTDPTSQTIELMGMANALLPDELYLVSLESDDDSDRTGKSGRHG